MSKLIYLAGPPSNLPLDADDAFEWHEMMEEEAEYFNAKTINPFKEKASMFGVRPEELTTEQLVEGALHAVLRSDAVLLRVDKGFNQPGGAVEMHFAHQNQTPIVGWLDHEDSPRTFYEYYLDAYTRDPADAMRQAKMLAL